jgi:hypothetical protein
MHFTTRRFDFTTVIRKGDKQKTVEIEIESWDLKFAYLEYHKIIERNFPEWTIISNYLGS